MQTTRIIIWITETVGSADEGSLCEGDAGEAGVPEDVPRGGHGEERRHDVEHQLHVVPLHQPVERVHDGHLQSGLRLFPNLIFKHRNKFLTIVVTR